MKKSLLTFLLLAAIFSLARGQGFRWQGVAKDASGNPVTQAVTLRFSILKNGAAVYSENHNPITPVEGQISATVGEGTPSFGTFSDINWSQNPYFLKVEMKIGGAAIFLDMGMSEMKPVPLALGVPEKSLLAGGKFVGLMPIFGSDEGRAIIQGDKWREVTRTIYTPIENYFSTILPIPVGVTREYFLVIRKADNITNCGKPEFRFWFTWAEKPGHQFEVGNDWGNLDEGQAHWVKIPSIEDQTGTNAVWQHKYWRLEAAIPASCPASSMRIQSIQVAAIDRPNGTKVPVKISPNGKSDTPTEYLLGDRGGRIWIKQTNMQVRSALDVRGAVIADVSANSGPAGRDAFQIIASPDNDAGVIVVNKPKLAIWSTTQNNLASIESGDASVRVLTIRGGSDLAENFDIQPLAPETTPEPGMLVSIDPDHPGALKLSTQAYDRRVAGVISGAGGIKPGMVMSQEESIADGKYPVAMVGRVYVQADAGFGKIEPGDFLTTSSLPGVAMKVGDPSLAQGAIIGKAMTSLSEGRGLVLVLVNLQ